MKMKLLMVGKTDEAFVRDGMQRYIDRLRHLQKFECDYIPDVKNAGKLPPDRLRHSEGERILQRIDSSDRVVLLDDKGKRYTSGEFSSFINRLLLGSAGTIVFVIGGAYGFSDEVYARANERVSLSKMTFPHQLVRVIFLEQLYRAFSILKNMPYHNE